MRTLLIALATMACAPAAAQQTALAPTQHTAHSDDLRPAGPTLLAGYGGGGFPITTRAPRAQAFFTNGVQLAEAFAHQAAVDAMDEAVRSDPRCAMCLWGKAWAAGPTINFGKSPEERASLLELARKANQLAQRRGTPRERALTRALVIRYATGDEAFARAMAALATRYPADDSIATIAADAWLIAGQESAASARRAMALLEPVLRRNPTYTPAIHFYIHATEDAGVPARAEQYADQLIALAPSSSHLAHMPSHTWYWVGRYEDAARANVRAVELGKANARKLGLPEPDGVWGLPYHTHNVVYGLGGAMMAGDAATALALGRPLVRASEKKDEATPGRQLIAASGYFAMARFAQPREVLAATEPKLPYLKAAWHYARGEAYAREGRPADLIAEAGLIPPAISQSKSDKSAALAEDMLTITKHVLLGRAAMLRGQPAEALEHFSTAAAVQESPDFAKQMDPPAFWYPVRRSMAEALLALRNPGAAINEVDVSLRLRPKDPAALAIRQAAMQALRVSTVHKE